MLRPQALVNLLRLCRSTNPAACNTWTIRPCMRLTCGRLLSPRGSHPARGICARATRFRPCIDIHKGKVKQIVGGSLTDAPGGESKATENFVSSQPSDFYARLYAGDALTGGHVIMLGADDASVEAGRRALAAWPGGLQVGGGVTTDNAVAWLDAGASHVIVTSFVFAGGELREDRLRELVKLVGARRLVLDLSCRKKADGEYYVVTDRWQKFTELRLNGGTLRQLAASCDEFLVHGVDVEGLQLGIDPDLVRLLGAAAEIPVTYAGGVRSLEDMELVKEAGNGNVDVTVGSALDIFGGKLSYESVVRWHVQQQRTVAL